MYDSFISKSAENTKGVKEIEMMNRWKIAQWIALGATVVSVLGFFIKGVDGLNDVGWTIMGIGIMCGLVSYIFGGLGTAVKMACGIAKWGWVIVPFPFDIVTFICAFIYAIAVFVCLPIIPVRKAYKECMRNSA